MAKPPVQDIVDTLADALRTITKANGYYTDLGLDVRTERSQQVLPTAPRCTVMWTNKVRTDEGKGRPSIGRGLRGVIEFEVPASFTEAMALVTAAEEDIDTCLRRYIQMPGALPVQYEEAVALDRPEGLPCVAAEIHWSTAYRFRGGS